MSNRKSQKCFSYSGTALVATLAVNVARAVPPSEVFTSFPQQGGVSLQVGWDSFKAAKTNAVCVDAGAVTEHGRYITTKYSSVSDTSSLMNALSISAQVKVQALLGGGGNATFDFTRNTQFDSSSLVIAADVTIYEAPTYLVPRALAAVLQAQADKAAQANAIAAPPPSAIIDDQQNNGAVGSQILLNAAALAILKDDADKGTNRFRDVCGDSFVSSMRRATGIQGTLTLETRSNTEKQTIATSISGNAGPWSAQANAKSAVDSLDSLNRIKINYVEIAAGGQPIPIDYKGFQSLVQGLGLQNGAIVGAPFEIGLRRYADLKNFPGQSPSTEQLNRMADQYYRLDSLNSAINGIIANNGQGADQVLYEHGVTKQTVLATQDKITSDRQSLKLAIQACALAPANCTFPPNVAKDDYSYRAELPVLAKEAASWVKADEFRSNCDAANNYVNYRNPNASFANIVSPAEITRRKNNAAAICTQAAFLKAAIDSTEDRFGSWLEVPNMIRSQNGEDDVVLSNNDLGTIHNKMISRTAANPNPPPPDFGNAWQKR